MPINAEVLAVCVNWNGAAVLGETLEALSRSDYPQLSTLVVDNASTDRSLELVPAEVEVRRLDDNLGYGAAINVVVRERLFRGKTSPAYLLLLNNDIVCTPGLVSRLVNFAESKGPGVYGPKILQYNQPGRLDMAWGRVNWSHVLARYHGKNVSDGPFWNQTRQVELLQGSALLIHRDVFRKIGLFDETFFMYHDEVDFLYRARRAGVPVYYCPFVSALHHGAHSSRSRPLQKVFWLRRNTVYFLRKYRPGPGKWAWFWLTLSASYGYNIAGLRWARSGAISRGLAAGFRLPVKDEPSIEEPLSQW